MVGVEQEPAPPRYQERPWSWDPEIPTRSARCPWRTRSAVGTALPEAPDEDCGESRTFAAQATGKVCTAEL